MMREVFEAFLTDPIRINEEIYSLWLAGHNANDALLIRMRTSIDLPGLGDDRTLQELLWRDTVDQYRLYEGLDHYLMQPSLFRSQLLFQIPPMQQHYMIECYYKLDRKVARWLVGKKLTAKLQKDLDEISDVAQCTLKSCRRQLENLRRIYSAMEDRNFQGIACQSISEQFLISESLASKYACVMFLQHARLEIHPTHAVTGFLTWQDLLFIAALLMVHWIPQRKRLPQLSHASNNDLSALSISCSPNPNSLSDSVSGSSSLVLIDNAATLALRSPRGDWPSLALLQDKLPPRSVRATMGLDLSPKMTNCLRDLKAHLINDGEMLAIYRQQVMRQLATSSIQDEKDLHNLSVKLYLVVHGVSPCCRSLGGVSEFGRS